MSANPHTTLPDTDTLTKAAQITIYNADGDQLSFGSLFEDKKTIVVFIRTQPLVLRTLPFSVF